MDILQAVNRALFAEARRIMEESKRMRPRCSPLAEVLPSGEMVRVRNGRLERFDDVRGGWLDVCGVEATSPQGGSQ